MIPQEGDCFLKELIFFICCWIVITGSVTYNLIVDKKDREWFLEDFRKITKRQKGGED